MRQKINQYRLLIALLIALTLHALILIPWSGKNHSVELAAYQSGGANMLAELSLSEIQWQAHTRPKHSAKKPVIKRDKIPSALHKRPVKPQPHKVVTQQNQLALQRSAKRHGQHNTLSYRRLSLASPPPSLPYPPSALAAHQEGRVVIKALIDAQGHVTHIVLLQKTAFAAINQAAIHWFRQLHFKPAQQGGHSVAAWVKQAVVFNLK